MQRLSLIVLVSLIRNSSLDGCTVQKEVSEESKIWLVLQYVKI
jgi:hypothetical protein